jgi:hypothetical protein
MLPPLIALITNATPKLYSIFLAKNFESDHSKGKFVVSLENALAFSMVILLQIFASYFDREFRLYFNYPMILIFCCDIFPLMIILKNKKMKQNLKNIILTTLENLNIKQNTTNIVAPF